MKLLLVWFVLLLFVFLSTPTTFAQCIPDPAAPADSTAVICKASGLKQLQELVTRLINISVTIAFIAMTVWLVWTAVKLFITSGGEPKALAQAWHSVTWIFLGLFFMVLAYLSLKLIFGVTGADVTKFCLGFPPYCPL